MNLSFAGILAYADDLKLLPASLYGFQVLIDVCTEVAGLQDVIFNETKLGL